MRFRTTMAFSEAHAEYQAARHEYATFDDSDDAAEARANERLDKADEALWGVPAITPTEIAMKISAAKDRARDDFPVEAFYSVERMQVDLARMQGWPVSPSILEAWLAWRKLAQEFTSRNEMTQAEEDALSAKQTAAYLELAKAPCTTPGDFILKHYARLLTEFGSTFYGEAREDMTGNPWDVDVDCDVGEATFETADKQGCYADIDATDVGANLLAYGLPYFDAEKWMERADAIGHRVDLSQQQDGCWMFGQWMDLEGEQNRGNNERIRREQDRLRRILCHNYGEDRTKLLSDEIRREWPQFVRPFPAEAMA